MPSRQRAVAVRLAHTRARVQAGQSAWISCDVIPRTAWLERCAAQGRYGPLRGLRRLGAAEEWLLWREAAEDACTGLGLLMPESLADSLCQSTSCARDWAMRWPGAPTPESSVLEQARRFVADRCQALSAYSVSDWTHSLRGLHAGSGPLVMAGFAPLGPALAARMQELGAALWPANLPAPDRPAAQCQGGADFAEELRRAARWCREQLERNPGARLLVVDTRLGARRALAVQAFEHELHGSELFGTAGDALYGIEGGQRLADYTIVQAALGWLRLSGMPLEFREMSALLRSPYIGSGTLAQRTALELTLRERNVAAADFAGLCDLARVPRSGGHAALADALHAIAPALTRAAGRREHGGVWARDFAVRLEAGGWPGVETLGSVERQQCERFRELLGELSMLGGGGAPLTFGQALELLRALAMRTSFEAATPDVPVTLTDSIDDPLVEYDGIWVAGLSADHWPTAPRADPFIPIAAQRAAGYRPASALGQLDAARQAMTAWRRCTRQLIYSWPEAEGDVPLQPSSLLGVPARPYVSERPRAGSAVTLDGVASRLRQHARLEQRPIDRAVGWPAGRRLTGGTRVLELQALCPFKAVAELRLGALPVREPRPGLDRRERGQALHRALELVFRQLKDSRGLRQRATDQPALTAMVRAASDQALNERLAARAQPLARALADNERARIAALIAALLRQELLRAESAEFTIAALEQSQDCELGGYPLRVRMDRIDRLDDGRVLVIDYKSGAAHPFSALDERPRQPQLLAYAVLATATVAGVAAVHLGADEIRWRGAAAEASLLPELGRAGAPPAPWPQLLGRWRSVVERLVREYAAGECAVDPLPDVCQYCQLPAFCRIEVGRRQELAPDAAETGAGEGASDGA